MLFYKAFWLLAVLWQLCIFLSNFIFIRCPRHLPFVSKQVLLQGKKTLCTLKFHTRPYLTLKNPFLYYRFSFSRHYLCEYAHVLLLLKTCVKESSPSNRCSQGGARDFPHQDSSHSRELLSVRHGQYGYWAGRQLSSQITELDWAATALLLIVRMKYNWFVFLLLHWRGF